MIRLLLATLLAVGLATNAAAQPKPAPQAKQQLLYERVRFGPLWEFIWPSGIGPRVAEPALMLIDPYPWSAPLEEVRLKPR